MGLADSARFVSGVWGPYRDAVIPGMWLSEAGLSSAGSCIDYVVSSHPYGNKLILECGRAETIKKLNEYILAKCSPDGHRSFTADIHVLPYFLGNRSPRADPSLLGGIIGLSLDESIESLAKVYLATIQAICYATLHIIETMNNSGFELNELVVSGGLGQNEIFVQELADATLMKVRTPFEHEAAVALGAAMLGAAACSHFDSITGELAIAVTQRLDDLVHIAAMKAMGAISRELLPRREFRQFHSNKYAVFHKMYADFQSYRNIMGAGQ